MNPFDPQRAFDATSQGLAADARSLDTLKRKAARDPQAALKGAAQQFEALFLQMVLKSMRDAVPKSGLIDSESQQMYTSMLDQQLATKISKSGTGLANVIANQLGRHLGNGNTGAKAAGAIAPAVQPATPVAPDATPASAEKNTPHAKAAIDRYAAIAATNPNTALREAELRRANATARAAYLARAADGAGAAYAASNAAANTATGAPYASAGAATAATGAPPPQPAYAQRTFANRMWDHAVAAQQATGIPAKFVLGQAALESGWGQREIKDASGLPTFNLFGIKAGAGWQGRTVDVVTTEYDNGVAKKVVEKFRAYNNYSEAFRDWAQMIAGNKRYAQVLQAGRAGEGGAAYAQGLARAGYATDPDYGAKLARVIASVGRARGDAV